MKDLRYLDIYVIWFILVNCYSTYYAQTIWRKVYAYQYELIFYNEVAKSYNNAEELCRSISASIIQLDDEYVRNAVYFTITSYKAQYFWIGATRNSTNVNEWNWASGSMVDKSSLEWYDRDNHNGNENNLIIRSNDNKLGTMQSTFRYAKTICQKERSLSNFPWKADTSKYSIALFKYQINWAEAYSECNDIKATLVQLDDVDVRKLVYKLINSSTSPSFWIGATRTCKTCDEWVWSDGTTVDMSLINWASGAPNNIGENEDKLIFKKIAKNFNDVPADNRRATICQRVICDVTPTVCDNGGTCSADGSGISSCKCTSGYYGATCSKGYCEAHSNPCKNSGLCSSTSNSTFYKCTCVSNGYYGATCEERYCETHTNPCQNNGVCSSTSHSPFYKCTCASNGYFGATCEVGYCEKNPNPCENSGQCSSTTKDPFFECTCASNGYYGTTCAELIQLTVEAKTIGIQGGYANIRVEVKTYDGLLTAAMYKGDEKGSKVEEKTDVGNGTTTFTFFISGTSDDGNYKIVGIPKSNAYSRSIITNLTVHVNATIRNVSPSFLFSPITNGPSEVACVGFGIPTPTVTWLNVKSDVETSSEGVYQTMQSNKAVLHVENAVLNDDGNYTCVATNVVGSQNIKKVSNKIFQLAVYGSPKIINIDASCGKKGTLTVDWEPNNQTTSLLHRFTAKPVNSSSPQGFNVLYKFYDGANIEFGNLNPYTLYEITIEVCPDQCLVQLNDSRKQITGHGLPDAVRNLNVQETADSCVVTWREPKSPGDQVTGYEVSISETWIYQPPDQHSSVTTTDTVEVDSQTTTYTLKTKFNRNYIFNITAKTCAGEGEVVVANGTCATKRSAPEFVPTAVLAETFTTGSTRKITVFLPEETNGPVSCSFVIVNQRNNIDHNSSFGIQQLQKAADAAFLEDASVSYLAIAIPRKNMVGGKFVTYLGDGISTSCDVSNIFTGNKLKKRSIGTTATTYSGKNKALLTGGTVYGFFVATTTPVENGLPLFQISQVQSFTDGQVAQQSYSIPIIGGSIAFLLVVMIAGSILIWKRKRSSNKDESNNQIQVSSLNEGSSNENIFLTTLPSKNFSVRNDRGSEMPYENVEINTGMDTGTDTCIPLEHLLRQYSLLKANESMKFCEQFQKIKDTSKTFSFSTAVGGSKSMKTKNRFNIIIPYDSTRAELKGTDGYINTSYVTSNKKKYIATQGPLRNTMKDFWQMIVEHNCKVIVMLTKCNEAKKRKCEKYWPDCNKIMQHGDINVLNQEETFFGEYVRRTLKIHTKEVDEHEVIHYQFLRWPDHGIPVTTSTFFRLHKAVTESYRKTGQSAPLVVHCSDGVGRTGVFIGYDMLLNEIENRRSVDFFNCILFMRKQRVDMVQACNQYELLHRLILEQYLFGETDVTEKEIRSRRPNFIDDELLKQEFQNLSLADSLNNNSDEKNQAHRKNVIVVRQPEDIDTERISIDAAYLEAYNQTTQLIAAQSPTDFKVEYFLRAILDNDIDIVVNLNEPRSKTMAKDEEIEYWPASTNISLVVNNVTVNLRQQHRMQGFVERKFVVSRNNNQQQKIVTQYHFTNWGLGELPDDTSEMLEFIYAIRNCAKGKATVVLVHCSDGLGKSGIVCALINLLERIEQEKKMDVFRTVKDLRNLRPGMMQTLNQYKFCYEVGQKVLSSESVYENPQMITNVEDPLYHSID